MDKTREAPLQYVPAMVIVQVFCSGCQNTIQLQSPATVLHPNQAHEVAMKAHNSAVLTCTRREFVITYSAQLIDKRILDDAAKGIIVPASGKAN